MKTKKYLIVTAIIMIFLSLVLFLSSCGNGFKTPIDNYYKAIETKNTTYMRSAFADYWIAYRLADYNETKGEKFLQEYLYDEIRSEISSYDCGDDIKITYSVIKTEKSSNEELNEFKKNIYSWYAYYVSSEEDFYNSVKDAAIVHLNVSVEGKDTTFDFMQNFCLINENGSWKITGGNLKSSFYNKIYDFD